MKLTIVPEDNIVIIDDAPKNFDLSEYDIPENMHALQWLNGSGEIEFNDENIIIDSLPEWINPIIEKHKNLVDEEKHKKEIEKIKSVSLINGYSRLQRKKEKEILRKSVEQEKINRFIKRSYRSGKIFI